MHREDFPMIKNNLVYFDNGATTFKPIKVIDAINYYYQEITSNANRGDYDISIQVTNIIEETRTKVKEFINAKKEEEIIFTQGATSGLNTIIFGYYKNKLTKDDEVLITKSEHASNILPWFILQEQIGIKVKYIPLNEHQEVEISNVASSITPKTKVISLAYATNVIGDIRPIQEITKLAHEHHIEVVVDGAQSTPHIKIDVQKDDIDFYVASGHKMYGPTGIGFLYGKYELLKETKPQNYGGGMNITFSSNGEYELKKLPSLLEGGTQNIEGIIGLGAAIDYIQELGLEKIIQYEKELHKYLVKKLDKLPYIKVYNKESTTPIVSFNIENIFSQDTALYLNKYHICLRAGNHCTKILKDEIKVANTCRISLAFYNTKEEIDLLINVLKNKENIWKEIL